MKTLQKLLLINWHFIVHETIELKRLNFLTGYLAHCVRIGDHEERQIVIDTLRAALQNEGIA